MQNFFTNSTHTCKHFFLCSKVLLHLSPQTGRPVEAEQALKFAVKVWHHHYIIHIHRPSLPFYSTADWTQDRGGSCWGDTTGNDVTLGRPRPPAHSSSPYPTIMMTTFELSKLTMTTSDLYVEHYCMTTCNKKLAEQRTFASHVKCFGNACSHQPVYTTLNHHDNRVESPGAIYNIMP